MNKIRVLLSVAALSALCAGTGIAAPSLDSAGKCRDNGKFVAASLCKATATTTGSKCRDIKTKKFAKCGAAGTEPVPAANKADATTTTK